MWWLFSGKDWTMSNMVSRPRLPAAAVLLSLVSLVVITGLLAHSVLDALPTWPASVAQSLDHNSAPARGGADRLLACAVHLAAIPAMPAPVSLLTALVLTLALNPLPACQPILLPPTAPPK